MFGGPTGFTRLVESSLGGQAGWLIGAALVGGIAVVLASRLRRSDMRSGWIILVGGAFLTCAVAFSTAKGIFHPYYVSLLAPFTAALVGALVPHVTGGGMTARVLACLGVAGAVATELMVLHNLPGELTWLRPVLFVAGAGLVAVLAVGLPARARHAVLVAALGLVLLAPATWAAQTLGHATNGTFPSGGPQTMGMGGGPGGGGPPGGGLGGPPGGAMTRGGGGGGGMFGGNTQTLTQAVAYARAHGGGAVATGSQQGAASPIIESGADVVAIGGFSGRESQVDAKWLAQAVRDGRVRWVLADQGGMGGPQDSRVGDRAVMSTVAETCKAVLVGQRPVRLQRLGGGAGEGRELGGVPSRASPAESAQPPLRRARRDRGRRTSPPAADRPRTPAPRRRRRGRLPGDRLAPRSPRGTPRRGRRARAFLDGVPSRGA